MPPRLPAIVPSARFDEEARAADGRGRVDEVGGGGEEVVGIGQDAGGQGGGDEVCLFVFLFVFSKMFRANWCCTGIVICISIRGGLFCQEVETLFLRLRGRGGRSTNACGAEGVVYLIRRDGIDGGGLDVLNRFGGECLDFHFLGGFVCVETSRVQ